MSDTKALELAWMEIASHLLADMVAVQEHASIRAAMYPKLIRLQEALEAAAKSEREKAGDPK